MDADESREGSLWHRTGPSIATDGALPARCDVLVVGAGLTGLTTARMLARAGGRPVVVEATRVGALTTGGTTGKVSLLQGSVYGALSRRAGPGVLRAYAAANADAQAWLSRETADDPRIMERKDAYTYATTPEGARTLEREAFALASTGLAVETLGDPGFSSVDLPFPVPAALRLRDQAQVHPMRLLRHLADATRAEGGTVVGGCRLLGASVTAGGVRVATTRGPVVADAVVLATGTPVLDRGLHFARITPSRELVGAYAVEGMIPDGMYLSVDPVSRSLRGATDETGDEVLLVGGASFVPGRGTDTTARLVDLDAWTRASFGPAERVAWWGAQDYTMAGRLPSAGIMPRSRGRILAATGYGKWGMTNAVAAAMTIVGELTGERPGWLAPLRARRPGIRSVSTAAAANAEVAGRLASGWARALVRSRPTRSPRVAREGARLVAESRVDGETCRVSGVCTHLGGVLEWNVAEQTWDCPLHGSRFRPDGRVVEGPAVADLAPAPTGSGGVRVRRLDDSGVEVLGDQHDPA